MLKHLRLLILGGLFLVGVTALGIFFLLRSSRQPVLDEFVGTWKIESHTKHAPFPGRGEGGRYVICKVDDDDGRQMYYVLNKQEDARAQVGPFDVLFVFAVGVDQFGAPLKDAKAKQSTMQISTFGGHGGNTFEATYEFGANKLTISRMEEVCVLSRESRDLGAAVEKMLEAMAPAGKLVLNQA